MILEQSGQIGATWHRHYTRLRLHTDKARSQLPFEEEDRPRRKGAADPLSFLCEFPLGEVAPHAGDRGQARRRTRPPRSTSGADAALSSLSW